MNLPTPLEVIDAIEATSPDDVATAWHEMAHALYAAERLGVVEYVTIGPARTTDPDRFAGQCWSRLSEHLLKRFPTLALAERACEALAGPFAAEIPRAEMRAGTDIAKARECAEIAYAYRPNPSSGDDPAAWTSAWVDLMCDRVRQLKGRLGGSTCSRS